MSDVFAVGLKTFSDDPEDEVLRTAFLGINGSVAVTNEIGGGITGLLSLLTVIGTSLSIVGVVLAFITYSLFSDLRTVSGTSLLNLLAALFLAHLILVIGVEKTEDRDLCLAVGFLLHYMWFAISSWLTVMFRDMYHTFKDNINLQPSPASEDGKSFLKCAIFAWGTPAVCISLAALIHFNTNQDKVELVSPTCWILGRASLMYAFVLPLSFLLVANCVFFVRSAILIHYMANLQITKKAKNKLKKKRYLQLFLYGKITLVITITWVCCIVAQFTDSIMLWISFTVLVSLQGFVISIAYCCNSKVFRLYMRTIRTSVNKPSYGSTELSRLTSLALLTWEPTPDAV